MSDGGFVTLAGGWRLLRTVFLRSTGFPVDRVLELADPEMAACADAVIQAEEACRARHREALESCRAARAEGDGGALRLVTRRLDRRLASGQPLALAELPDHALLAPLRAAIEERDRALGALTARAEVRAARDAEILAAVASEPALREALTWQNRNVTHTALAALADEPDDGGRRQRKRALALWSYLQRYATKNETIGFFGPAGWARMVDHGPPLEVRPGPQLVARRTVYLEHWCVDALAAALGRDRALRAETAPRRATGIRLDGDVVRSMPDEALDLPPAAAEILRRCDGRTSARAIAEGLAESPDEIEQIYDLLDEMAEAELVVWRLDVALGHERHEEGLRRQLERMPDSPARAGALAALGELEAARDGVAAAAGDADALDRALAALDDTFVRLTGRPPTRLSGRTYAGRTLVVEECVRDVEVAVGPALREQLAAPLALLFDGARWLTDRIAAYYRGRFEETFAELQAEHGSVELLWLAQKVAPLLSPDLRRSTPGVAALGDQLRLTWQRMLAPAPGERRVTRSAAELAGRAREAFAGAAPGWPMARWHSPDIMIATDGPDAAARGDFLLVLGELHLAIAGPAAALALREHPDVEQLARTVVAEMTEPRITWLGPAAQAVRTNHAQGPRVTRWRDDEAELETADGRSALPRAQVFAVSDFVVERDGDRLIARARDGRRRFDLLEMFAGPMCYQAANAFGLLPEAPHTPRVTIDSLVVARETWRFAGAEVPLAREKSAGGRFVAARRWRLQHDLPRFLFARTPEEVKPIYVDLACPLSIEHLARMTRAASRLTVSEMLPAPTQAWLNDARGRRYSAELRIAAVDAARWET
jgi:hypothetical protein